MFTAYILSHLVREALHDSAACGAWLSDVTTKLSPDPLRMFSGISPAAFFHPPFAMLFNAHLLFILAGAWHIPCNTLSFPIVDVTVVPKFVCTSCSQGTGMQVSFLSGGVFPPGL